MVTGILIDLSSVLSAQATISDLVLLFVINTTIMVIVASVLHKNIINEIKKHTGETESDEYTDDDIIFEEITEDDD